MVPVLHLQMKMNYYYSVQKIVRCCSPAMVSAVFVASEPPVSPLLPSWQLLFLPLLSLLQPSPLPLSPLKAPPPPSSALS